MDGGIFNFFLLISLPGHPILPLVSCPYGALSKWLVVPQARGGQCFTRGSRPPPKKKLDENEKTGLIFTLAQPQISPNSPLFFVSFSLVWSASFTYQL